MPIVRRFRLSFMFILLAAVASLNFLLNQNYLIAVLFVALTALICFPLESLLKRTLATNGKPVRKPIIIVMMLFFSSLIYLVCLWLT